jgi:hypothetical protein
MTSKRQKTGSAGQNVFGKRHRVCAMLNQGSKISHLSNRNNAAAVEWWSQYRELADMACLAFPFSLCLSRFAPLPWWLLSSSQSILASKLFDLHLAWSSSTLSSNSRPKLAAWFCSSGRSDHLCFANSFSLAISPQSLDLTTPERSSKKPTVKNEERREVFFSFFYLHVSAWLLYLAYSNRLNLLSLMTLL